jgi:hypothetical protein
MSKKAGNTPTERKKFSAEHFARILRTRYQVLLSQTAIALAEDRE